MKEHAVLTSVLAYLGTYPGVMVWRNNTGAIPDRTGRVIRFGRVGSADVIGIAPGGRFLAVECKSSTGRLSEAQRNFAARVQACGGLYLVVRQVSDLHGAFPPLA